MKKKFLSIFLTLAACLALLSVTAAAAETMTYVTATGTASAKTYTELTATDSYLDSGTYLVQGEVQITDDEGLYFTGDTTLVLADGATLTVDHGIFVDGTLTVTTTEGAKNAKLVANDKPYDEEGYGIGYAIKADSVSIYAGTVEATGGENPYTADAATPAGSFGIYATTGDVTVANSAKVTATGTDVTGGKLYAGDSATSAGYGNPLGGLYGSFGVYATGTVTVSDTATVTAKGGTAENTTSGSARIAGSYGIYAKNVSVTGGAVTATGGNATAKKGTEDKDTTNAQSAGIFVLGGSTVITGSSTTVTAKGGTVTADGNAAGIYDKFVHNEDSIGSFGIVSAAKAATDSLTISDGATVKATGGDMGIFNAICGGNDGNGHRGVIISGSGTTVTATGGNGGINAKDGMTVTDSTIKAYSGKDATSIAIQATGRELTISGAAKIYANANDDGTRKAGCGDATTAFSQAYSYGIHADELNISGGEAEIYAYGGNAETSVGGQYARSCGIYLDASNATATIDAKTIVAVAGSAKNTGVNEIGYRGDALSYGLYGGLNLTGGTVTVKSGAVDGGSGSVSCDVFANESNITVSGGTVQSDATGAAVKVIATADKYGSYGTVTLNGGTLTLAEGSAVYKVAVGDNVKDLLPADCAFAASGSKVKLTEVTVANALTVVTCDHKDADNNPAAGTDGRCSYCGTSRDGDHTVRLTHEGNTSGYVNFADAHNAAEDGDTIQLLADMTDALSINKAVTLDLNGKNVSGLTVGEPATVTDSAGGGVISSLTIDVSDLTVGGLLESGCGFKDGSTWYDSTSTETSISNVTVKKIPITSVSISTTDNKSSFTYGEDVVLTATPVLAAGYSESAVTYKWENAGSLGEDLGSTQEITLTKPTPSTDNYNIVCKVTVDGYLISEYIEFTVSKAELSTSDYTAPTAKPDLVFNNNEQELVSSGTSSISGPTFMYGKKNASGKMEWSDTASHVKGCNAGTYTVYWYIDGGANYENVGSQEKPAGEIAVIINPKLVGEDDITVTVSSETLTYDGTAKQPTVTVKVGDDTTLVKDTDYTVAYENNINAGDQAKVTVTAKQGSNYTFAPVTTYFSIAKAAISFTPPTVKNTDYNGEAQQLIATAGLTANGTFYYRLGESGEWTTDITTLTATDAGSYAIYYYVEGDANHWDRGATNSPAGSITASIRKINLSENCTVTLDQTTYTYDGTVKTPTVTVKYGDTTLVKDVDYTVTGRTSETDVEGYYLMQVVATESGNFTGQKPMSWHITPAPLTITGVTATDKSYDGTTDAAVSVSFDGLVNGETLIVGTDYTVSGSFNNSNAGTDKTVTATVTLISSETAANYTLTGSVPTTRAAINQKVVDLSWTNTDLTYDGSAQKPTATATGLVNGDTCTVTVSGAQTNAGGNYTATATGLSNSNYKLPEANTTAFSIAQANPRTLADIPVSLKYSVTTEQSVQIGSIMPADAGTLTYSVGEPAMTDTAAVTGFTVSNTGLVKFAVTGIAGNRITLPVKINSTNYAESTVNVVVTLTEKDAQAALTITSGTTVTYGQTLTLTTSGGTGTGAVSYEIVSGGNGEATIDGNVLTPTKVGTVQVKAAKAADADYTSIESAVVTITINKATPTGAPKYTAITTSGKTLADAALDKNTGWPDGTVQWVDASGVALADTTEVVANTAYKWLFTPTDSTNYNTINGTVTLWHKSSGGGSSSGGSGTTITVPVSSNSATVNVKAEVSKGNATVEVSDKQIEQVANDGAGDVTIDVSGLKNVDSATVPSHVVEKTNEAENTGLTVALPAGSVTLDETALESVTENADGKDVTVSVVAVPTEKLPTAVKDIIGMEPTVVAVVDVNVTISGKKQSSFDGGKVTISVPYTPKKGEDTGKLTVWFIRDDGTIENKGGYYDAKNKCFVFETDHLSQYILVNTNEMVSFTDVPADAYFANAVSWAAGKGITGGVDATHFMPHNACTRAQIVTFLWRAAGSPEPKAASSFTDVSANAYYAKAVAWAVENGITGGIGNNQFAPDLTCTRAQAAAFLFRYAAANGMEAVTLQELVGGYSDAAQVPGYALPAFNWALAKGIVNGYNGNLMPNNDCTRAQIVTMLYRLLGK